MSGNLVALARMATGRVAKPVPIYEESFERITQMEFPVSSFVRAHAFLGDQAAVDSLLAMTAKCPLQEFEDTIPLVHAMHELSAEKLAGYRSHLDAQVAITGGDHVARLVYAAPLGVIDEACRAADRGPLCPAVSSNDIMGPDSFRSALLFQAGMPELRNDPRFPRLCACLGLVQFGLNSGLWPDCADEMPYDFRRNCEEQRNLSVDDFGFLMRPGPAAALSASRTYGFTSPAPG